MGNTFVRGSAGVSPAVRGHRGRRFGAANMPARCRRYLNRTARRTTAQDAKEKLRQNEGVLRACLAHAFEGGACLREFLGEDAHDLKTQLRFLAQKIEQALPRQKGQTAVFKYFSGQTVTGVGEGGGQAHHRSQTDFARGKAGGIAVESESDNSLSDQEDAGYGFSTAKQIGAAGTFDGRPARSEM